MSSTEEHPNERAEDDEPTAEEVAQMRAATSTEAATVDAMILGRCSDRFQKVAMIVGRLLGEFDERFPHLPYAYVQARMQKLEDAGRVEIAGDVWSMRQSEVRLTKRPE